MLPPVCPLLGVQDWTTTPARETPMSPKLQPPVPGAVSRAVKAPTAPSPVTGAPRATMDPLWFQTTHTATGAPGAVVGTATTVGWSTLPVNDARSEKVAPPSVLRMVTIAFTEALMYVMNRLPKVSQASVGSQHADGPWPGSPSTIVLSAGSG
jgi:hypothetical protein